MPRRLGLLLLLFSPLATGAGARGADADAPAPAPVVIDGVTLFHVRGVSAFPAEERARIIADRIRAVAADRGLSTSALRIVPAERSSDILMGDRPIAAVLDADAQIEGTHRQDPASAHVYRIRAAIDAYRHDRSPRSLLHRHGGKPRCWRARWIDTPGDVCSVHHPLVHSRRGDHAMGRTNIVLDDKLVREAPGISGRSARLLAGSRRPCSG